MGRRKNKQWRNNYPGNNGQVGATAAGSNTQEALQPSRSVYRLNEKLDRESRSVEYKEGRGFINHDFRPGVAKYVCGFLNSGGFGKLMLGITDSGTVCGLDLINKTEDSLALQIDEAIKDIRPTVFTRDYAVHFIPIIDDITDTALANCKVIEISVGKNDARDSEDLFETKQGVFIRRDASIEGPLKAQQIKQWYKSQGHRQINEEKEKHKKNEENWKIELKTKQSEFDIKMKEIEEREEELRIKDQELEKKEQELRSQKQEQQFKKEEENATHSKLADKVRDLQEENNQLKQHQSESSKKTHQELTEIKQLLATQADASNKKSKVCVIS